jgi:hypothetical protein
MKGKLILLLMFFKVLPSMSQVNPAIYYKLNVIYEYSPIDTRNFDNLLTANNYPSYNNYKSNWGIGLSIKGKPFIANICFTGLDRKSIDTQYYDGKIACSNLTISLGFDLLQKSLNNSIYPYFGLRVLFLKYSIIEKSSTIFNNFLSARSNEINLYYNSPAIDLGIGYEHQILEKKSLVIITLGINIGAIIYFNENNWSDTGIGIKLTDGPAIRQSFYHIRAFIGLGIKREKKINAT